MNLTDCDIDMLYFGIAALVLGQWAQCFQRCRESLEDERSSAIDRSDV
jgi:hypothetical protein